ncbi:hypothetical protein [Leadbetterella byssophila]|uniref:hypothetical protein n=1 Tax=Leadbetterella byssophila TaxID=316068 RepID=UPI0039A170FD
MKRLLIFSNLITAGLLGMFVMKSCAPKDAADEAISGRSGTLKNTQLVMDYSNVPGFKSMSIPQAMLLKKNYMENVAPVVNKALGLENTESLYYTLEELKNMIWTIEYYAKASGKNVKSEDLGVHVHFGQYPKNDLLKHFPQLEKIGGADNKAGKTTIFFVPTIIQNGKRFEFNPKKNYLEISSGRSKAFKKLSEHHKNDLATFKLVDYDEDSPIPDFANIQPPYYD